CSTDRSARRPISYRTECQHRRSSLISPLLLFFFNDTPTTEIYTLSLHDALPISGSGSRRFRKKHDHGTRRVYTLRPATRSGSAQIGEHTSELQSLAYLVCRLLLEKKKIHRTRGDDQHNDGAVCN